MEQKRLTLPNKPELLKSLGAGEGNWRGEWPKGGRFRKHPLLAALVFIPVFVLRAGGRTKSEPHKEGPRESVCLLLLPGQNSLLSMALQERQEPDVYQENFEPTSYLEYYRMNQDPVGDEVLHFLLKHYNATFKPGADPLQPWGRFVGGRVATQILNQMLVFFHCRAVLE